MLFSALLAMATPLAATPERFYEPEFSAEAGAVFAAANETSAEDTRAALEALAREGDVSALEVLGEIHMFGHGAIARDPARGCDYFEQVGDRRADSLHNLASCYWNGDGRAQDYPKARALYRKAAEAGWRMSFCAYGKMLLLGQGGAADAAEGIRLCRMTALLGDKHALADYGTFLLTGQGVERDPVTARFMLERAAEQDQPNAAFLLGQIHSKGDGTPVDPATAAQWFEKAWDGGRSDAAEQVAASYLRLGYIQQDDERVTLKPAYLRKARSWYEKALAAERPGSERHGKIAALIPTITSLIADAEGSGGD
ncbi:tetratricopeptide repeat protein [Porphyrobacter sp. YT40]|uniref:tetratricopeptide repeat protein n=1 Tax=Porphyrobacter sp. YT40 TaxID=2547601 RepID=UPI001143DA2C|nr:tetratricopeptide repeat protein [Porphyrobacter sp. YT40]QDH33452.1 sel1 repeat family protein [Porphyrobacter sp. YT40]